MGSPVLGFEIFETDKSTFVMYAEGGIWAISGKWGNFETKSAGHSLFFAKIMLKNLTSASKSGILMEMVVYVEVP